MSKLSVFNFITLNGFYKGENEDISWHKHGGEEGKYSEEMLSHDSILLFGRVTYQMMSSFWPTEMAAQSFPEVARGMNSAEKIVLSSTLKNADWSNTKIISSNAVEEMKKLKRGKKDIAVLGSGSVITLLAENDLIDEYQVMIDPVIIPSGKSFLPAINKRLDLKLIHSKVFSSGIVLLNYININSSK